MISVVILVVVAFVAALVLWSKIEWTLIISRRVRGQAALL